MKSLCVFLLPRQVQALFVFVCSCHMLLLLNFVKVPLSNREAPGTQPPSRVKVISEGAVRLSPNEGGEYKHVPREARAHHSPRGESHSTTRKQSPLAFYFGEQSGANSPNIIPHGPHNRGVESKTNTQNRILNSPRNISAERKGYMDYDVNRTSDQLNPTSKPDRVTNSMPIKNEFTFEYLINQPELCSQSEESNYSVHSVIIALSHPYHNAERDAIRNTWARYIQHSESPTQLRLVFVLGVSDLIYSEEEQLNRVRREARLFRDVIVGDFNDTYQNLTLKSLFALQWVSEYCNATRYVVKTDDDTFVNIVALRNFLGTERNESIIGSLNTNGKVMRTGLWEVPEESYPYDTYPPYCMGCIYVLSSRIIPQLLKSAKSIQLIPIEDTFITGILAQDNEYTCTNSEYFPEWYMSSSTEYTCKLLKHELLALHHVPYEVMYKLQDIIKNSNISNYCHSN